MLCSLNKYCKIKLCDIPETIRSNQIINVGYITDNKYNKINVEVEYFEDKIIRNNYIITPIELENGEELSQLIICKYLYKEDDNKENEGLALKYQILSNYTTLFAEIELSNKMSDEMKSKIIGHEKSTNNIKNKIYEENIFCYRNKVNPSLISRKSAFPYIDDDDGIGLKLQFLEFNSFEPENLRLNEENTFPFNCDEIYKANNSFSYEKKGAIKFSEKKEESFWNFFDFFDFFKCCFKKDEEELSDIDYDNKNNEAINNNLNNSNNNKEKDKEKKNEIKNLEKKDNIMKIINNQNYIEGFWEYNEQTKYIKDKYLDKFNLIKGKLNLMDKTIMTILIIYFIEKDHRELLKELDLIIQKGKIYIQKETNKSYEEIINKIGI